LLPFLDSSNAHSEKFCKLTLAHATFFANAGHIEVVGDVNGASIIRAFRKSQGFFGARDEALTGSLFLCHIYFFILFTLETYRLQLRFRSLPMQVSKVSIRQIGASHQADNPTLLQVVYHGKGEQVLFHEQFHCSV